MPDPCRHCGKPESEHCVFEAKDEPQKCCCFSVVPMAHRRICGAFRPGSTVQWCLNCAHDEACHKGKG